MSKSYGSFKERALWAENELWSCGRFVLGLLRNSKKGIMSLLFTLRDSSLAYSSWSMFLAASE